MARCASVTRGRQGGPLRLRGSAARRDGASVSPARPCGRQPPGLVAASRRPSWQHSGPRGRPGKARARVRAAAGAPGSARGRLLHTAGGRGMRRRRRGLADSRRLPRLPTGTGREAAPRRRRRRRRRRGRCEVLAGSGGGGFRNPRTVSRARRGRGCRVAVGVGPARQGAGRGRIAAPRLCPLPFSQTVVAKSRKSSNDLMGLLRAINAGLSVSSELKWPRGGVLFFWGPANPDPDS